MFLLVLPCVVFASPVLLARDSPASTLEVATNSSSTPEIAKNSSSTPEVAKSDTYPPFTLTDARQVGQILAIGHGPPVLNLWAVAASEAQQAMRLRSARSPTSKTSGADPTSSEAEGGKPPVLLTAAIWFALTTLVAHFYRSGRSPTVAEHREADDTKFQQWTFGLFACLEEPSLAIFACCCPAIRWGENLSYVPGLLTFWAAFFFYSAALMLDMVTATALGTLVIALVCTSYRQEIRSKFNMERGGMTYITDCLSYLCCTCCAIVQEARHIEAAVKAGHPAMASEAATYLA